METSGLLRCNPDFRRYWLGRVVSYTGSRASVVALTLQVAQHPHGVRAVGLLLSAQETPRLLGPLVGVLADRRQPRRLLIACDLGQAALVLIIALALPPLPVTLLLVAAASTLAVLFGVTGRALLPHLVPRSRLLEANAWLGTAFNLQGAAGPLLAAGLVALAGTRAALITDVASFLASALLLRTLPRVEAVITAPVESCSASVRQGVAFVIGHPVTRWTLALVFGGVLLGSLENLALVFLTRDSLDGGPTAFALVFTAFALGTIVGSLALTRRGASTNPVLAFVFGWALTGAALLATGVAPTLVAAAATMAVLGGGNGLTAVGQETILQVAVPPGLLGRVSGVAQLAVASGTAITYLAGPWLVQQTSPRTTFLVAGGGTLVLVAAVAPGLRSAWSRTPRPPNEPAAT